MGFKKFLYFSIFILLINTASAATLDIGYGQTYSTDGVDDQDQINNAIRDAVSGDTVYLHAGTYTISSPIIINNKNGIIIKGAGTNLTTIHARNYLDFLQAGKYSMIMTDNFENSELYGFRLEGAVPTDGPTPGKQTQPEDYDANETNDDSENGMCILGVSDGLKIHDIYFTQLSMDGIYSTDTANVSVYNCVFNTDRHDCVQIREIGYWNITNCFMAVTSDTGVRLTNAQHCIIQKCTMNDLAGGYGRGGIYFQYAQNNNTIDHNIFRDMTTPGLNASIFDRSREYFRSTAYDASGNAKATNNVFYNIVESVYDPTPEDHIDCPGVTLTSTTGNLYPETVTDWAYYTDRGYGYTEAEAAPVEPTAGFSTDSIPGTLTVQFTDASLGVPTSWNWNFGDNTTNSTEQNPTHTFAVGGIYNITQTVSNTQGTNSYIRTIQVAKYTNSRGGIFAYIPNYGPDTVSIIDLSNNTEVNTVPVGINPMAVAVHPNGSNVYIPTDGDNGVSVLDPSTNGIITTITVGSHPRGGAVSPDGSEVYITDYSGAAVSIIDTTTNTVTDTITVGTQPQGVVFSPDGTKAYIVNSGSKTVSVIDTSTKTITATVTVGSTPIGVGITPNGAKVYVSNFDNTNVSVIDTSTNTVSKSVTVQGNPVGIAANPSGAKMYVANYGGDSVSVIDTSTDTVSATVPVGDGPRGISVTPDGTKIYTANRLAGTVSEIDATSETVTDTITLGSTTNPYALGQFIADFPNAPIPNFEVNSTSGFPPKSIKFNDTSTGSPTSWAWDFDDDSVIESTEQNPVFTYTTAGTYNVNLTATNADGSATETKTAYIEILPAPTTAAQWFWYIISLKWW